MKVSYAVRVEDIKEVREWMQKVGGRLREKRGVLIGGRLKRFAPGVYVVSVETLASMWGILIAPLMLVFVGVVSSLLWGKAWAMWISAAGVAWIVFGTLLMAPGFHRLLMRWTLYRIMGRRVRVEPYTSGVMELIVYGKR